eukprot:TRINITY_DN3489_c2_g2_i1.p1 TRINITY_DN3489_c2_g2~~TRINITY_DN3489_c2_g2_i1.p1  ORF type:complete len:276 (+),score=51.97 TRINITY_DN3489_c2_g2_i1:81-908(+)
MSDEGPIEYTSRKQIPEIIDAMMLRLVDARPDDPKAFMAAVLVGAPPPAPATGKVQLFLARVSVNCHPAWILLRQASIDYELRDVDLMKGETRTPEYLAMNPLHTVPMIKDSDGTCVFEGNAILRYLASKYASARKFYPIDVVQRAHCEMCLDWRQTTFYPKVAEVAYPVLGFMEFPADTISAATEKLTNTTDGIFKIFIDFFLNGKKFICGDDPTIADFSVVPCFAFIDVTDIEIPAAIQSYRERFNAAVDYKEVLDGQGSFGTSAMVEMKKGK